MAEQVKYTFVALDRFSRVASRVDRHAAGLQRRMGRLGRAGAIAGRALRGVGMAAVTGVTAGLTAAIRTGSVFQDSMADLQAITGLSGDKLGYMERQARRLGKTSQTSAAEVSTGFKTVASRMQEIAQQPEAIANVTEQILLLKNASGIDMAEATEAVTKGLAQFGEESDQAARFVNVLAAGAKIGASEVGATSRALIKAGVAAQLSGMSFEETTAAVQVLAKGGLVAENAGTLLSSTLLKLEKSGIKAVTPSIVGMATAFENIAAAGLNSKQMAELFGEEAIKAGGTLTNLAPLLREFTRRMTGTSVAQEQAAIRMATFSARARALWVVIQDKLITAFQRMEKPLTGTITKFGQWIDSIQPSQVQEFADAIVNLGASLEPIAKLSGQILGVTGGIARGFNWAADVYSGFGAASAGAVARGMSPPPSGKWQGQLGITVGTEKGATADVGPLYQAGSGSMFEDIDVGVSMAGGLP